MLLHFPNAGRQLFIIQYQEITAVVEENTDATGELVKGQHRHGSGLSSRHIKPFGRLTGGNQFCGSYFSGLQPSFILVNPSRGEHDLQNVANVRRLRWKNI